MTNQISCSFCGLPSTEVAHLIAGPTVAICSTCIEMCVDILAGIAAKAEPETKDNAMRFEVGKVYGRGIGGEVLVVSVTAPGRFRIIGVPVNGEGPGSQCAMRFDQFGNAAVGDIVVGDENQNLIPPKIRVRGWLVYDATTGAIDSAYGSHPGEHTARQRARNLNGHAVVEVDVEVDGGRDD